MKQNDNNHRCRVFVIETQRAPFAKHLENEKHLENAEPFPSDFDEWNESNITIQKNYNPEHSKEIAGEKNYIDHKIYKRIITLNFRQK